MLQSRRFIILGILILAACALSCSPSLQARPQNSENLTGAKRPGPQSVKTIIKKSGPVYKFHISIPSPEIRKTSTDMGMRSYIRIKGAKNRVEEGFPPAPMIEEKLSLPDNCIAGKPEKIRINKVSSLSSICPPIFRPVTQASGLSSFTGGPYAGPDYYPLERVAAKVMEDNTLIVRVFPVIFNIKECSAKCARTIEFSIPVIEKRSEP